ncbi:MAG: sarcosine oxidase subunit gamma family protein [Paracoccaceae bacterium]
MDKITLTARDAFTGMGLPHAAGTASLHADTPPSLVAIAPFAGQESAVSAELKKLGGGALPAAGHSAPGKAMALWWSGHGQWLALGAELGTLQAALAGKAAVVDQSDGWGGFSITGSVARDVMGRLCPLDTHPGTMPTGHVARSQFAHMMAVIYVLEDGFQVLVMRSFLKTAIEDTKRAIDTLAAEAPIRGR